MNFQQLSTFCTVLAEGSMTAAAEKMSLTQPAVSQQIRNLEDELGVELLVRGVRQVKPTLQGQILFDYAKKILHLSQQAEVALQTMSQEVSGNLRIATLNSIGLYMVSPMIGLFLKHNTQLKVKIAYGTAEKIISDMRSQAVDAVILPDLRTEHGIEFPNYEPRYLFKDEMWLVGSGRDSSLPTNTDIRGFASRPVIRFTDTYPSFRHMIEKKTQEAKIKIEPVLETENIGTLKRVVESGLGWGFLPSHSIRKQVRAGRLVQIQADEMRYSVNVNLYCRKDPLLTPVYDILFKTLQQQALSS